MITDDALTGISEPGGARSQTGGTADVEPVLEDGDDRAGDGGPRRR
jgi:hypothetical protein